MQTFDLTTPKGLKKAINNPWLSTNMAFKKTFELFSNADIISEQRKTAIELIKAGKEKGVDELEIVLDQKAGLNIEAEVKRASVKTQLGKDGKIIVKVKYE